MRKPNAILLSALVSVMAAGSGLGCEPASAEPETPRDDDAVEQELKAIIAHLDSEAYRNETTFDEHVVATYLAVREREPTTWELRVWRALKEDLDLPPSAVLALLLRGNDVESDGAVYRRFVQHRGISSFRASVSISDAAARLSKNAGKLDLSRVMPSVERDGVDVAEPVVRKSASPGETYNTYARVTRWDPMSAFRIRPSRFRGVTEAAIPFNRFGSIATAHPSGPSRFPGRRFLRRYRTTLQDKPTTMLWFVRATTMTPTAATTKQYPRPYG